MGRLTWTLIACLLLLADVRTSAQQPAGDPPQFIHSSWTTRDGVPGMIRALAQTPDGFLWLGTYEGLYRFDGVTFEKMPPAPGHPVGAVPVTAAHVMRNGELWVGYAGRGGVEIFRSGRLVRAGMPHAPGEVTGFAEDQDGGVWALGGRDPGTLQRFWRGRWYDAGTDLGIPNEIVSFVFPARDGTLWLATSTKLLFRRRGETRFSVTSENLTDGASLEQDAAGRLWLADASSTRIIPNYARGETRVATPISYPAPPPIRRTSIVFDEDGGLWQSTYTGGIFHITDPSQPGGAASIVRYRVPQGMSSNQAVTIFADRERNIWVGTDLGLDQFRRARVEQAGLPERSSAFGYLMSVDNLGDAYVAAGPQLYRIRAGRKPDLWLSGLDEPQAMCRAADGGFWLAVHARMLHFLNGAITERVALPPAIAVNGCASDSQNRLWLAKSTPGVLLRDGATWRNVLLGRGSGTAQDIILNAKGSPYALVDRQVLVGIDPADNRSVDEKAWGVAGLTKVTRTSRGLLIGGGTGLALWDGTKVRRLSIDRHPWLRGIRGALETPQGDLWMINNRGILHVRAADLYSAFEQPSRQVPYELLSELDGMTSRPQGTSGEQVAIDNSGGILFLTGQGMIRVRPRTLYKNDLAPSVLIRALTTDGRTFVDPKELKLKAGTSNLSIDYTALSLSVPSRVRFRYKLDGVDDTWVDPSNRRQAFYTNLKPGTYVFRVIAANEDGVWNRTGATLRFTIPPTFTQSNIFLALCVLLALAILWMIYAIRLRSVARALQSRMAERLAERERIARDLHDTLLQGVQALILRFGAASDSVTDERTRAALDATLDRADELLLEGRDKVSNLRLPSATTDLEKMLRDIVRRQNLALSVSVDVSGPGHAAPMEPATQQEIAAIVSEALFNAGRHAHAANIDIKMEVRPGGFTLGVSDDGIGIDPKILRAGGRPGHFGFTNMRERAAKIGADLEISSEPGRGTQILLSFPARHRFSIMTLWKRLSGSN